MDMDTEPKDLKVKYESHGVVIDNDASTIEAMFPHVSIGCDVVNM
jgi:hypothetical protein